MLFSAEVSGGRVFVEANSLVWHFRDFSSLQAHHDNSFSPLPAQLKGHAFKAEFVGAHQNALAMGEQARSYHHNYYLGDDMNGWAKGVQVYGAARLREIYPGINLKVYAQGQTFKYDLELKAGADPSQISIRYHGLDSIRIKDAELELFTSVNKLVEMAPYAYQLVGGQEVPVPCRFVLEQGQLRFEFPEGYNTGFPLVIDPPTLIFGSYSGAISDNWGYTATYDEDGALYGGGISFGVDYPTTMGAYQSTWAGGVGTWPCDITISKFSPDGSNLEYSTFLGGSGNDLPHSMICTPSGELWLYGTTGSNDYPTTPGCVDNTFNGGSAVTVTSVIAFPNGTDMFVSKLDASGGNLLASTYLGGSANDGLNLSTATGYNYGDHARGEIIVDRFGQPIIASSTLSANFPVTAGAYQTTYGGNQDGVIVKYNSDLTSLVFSTFIGGSLADAAYSMKLGGLGGLVICGGTTSIDFPVTAGAYQSTYQGGQADGWVARINISGTTLMHSTYIGTSSYDQVFMVETDDDQNVYITGQTTGAFPVSPGVYSNPGSAQFLAKMNMGLSSFEYSTVFGSGTNRVNIRPTAFLVDKCKNVYISGWGGLTNSSFNSNVLNTFGLPVTADASQSSTDGSDFYFIVFARDADSLLYATFFGGNQSREHVDGGTSRFDRNGIIYQAVCAGCGGRDDFPTTPGVWSNVNNSSNCNLGVIKYRFDFEDIRAGASAFPDSIGCVNFPVQFYNHSENALSYFWDFGDGYTSTEFEPSHLYVDTGLYQVMLVAYDSTKCIPTDTAWLTITALVPIDTTYDLIHLCQGETVFLEGGWQSNPGVYTDTYLSQYGCDSTVISTVIVNPTYYDTTVASICIGDTYMFYGVPYTVPGLYTQSFLTPSGCDSIFTLSLLVDTLVRISENISICDGDSVLISGVWQSSQGVYIDTVLLGGGCDTIYTRTLDLIRFDVSVELDLCLGDSVFVGGAWQSGGGSFLDSLLSSGGCDSLVTTQITLRLPESALDSLIICSGDSALLGGSWQSSAGDYIDTLINRYGCDSVISTSLILLPVYYSYDTLQVCTGDSALLITGAGGGTFVHTWTSSLGCDSLVEYFVTPLPNAFGTDSLAICAGDSLLLDQWVSQTGNYNHTLTAANGCDSIVDVFVHVLDTFISITPLDICAGDSVLILGQWQSSSGFYADTLSGNNGCDSILAWQLVVRPHLLINRDMSICAGDSVFLGGAWQQLPGLYTDSLTSVFGCDSVLITALDTLPVYYTAVNVGICPGDSVLLYGSWYNSPAFYQDTLSSAAGCDSIISGQVYLFPEYLHNHNLTLCLGDSVFLQGAWQSGAGIYTDTLLSANACDSIVRTTVSVLPESGSTIQRYICVGDSVFFDGQWLSSSGTYTQSLIAANGCDSVVTLDLQAEGEIFIPLTLNICSGDSVFAAGAWQNSAGVYTDSMIAALGCDSIVQTTLLVHPSVYDTIALSVCLGDSVLLAGAWQSIPGVYTEYGSGSMGCDSISVYVLSHRPVNTVLQAVEICSGDSVFLGGAWQSTAGVYSEGFTNTSGCDSTVLTTLVVRPSWLINRSVSICFGDSLFAGGSWQFSSGLYIDASTTAFGCDSIVRTALTVLPVTASAQNAALCQGDTLLIGSTVVTGPGTYFDQLLNSNGCDSIVQYNITILPSYVRNIPVLLCEGDSVFLSGQWISSPGEYPLNLQTTQGCDSIIRYQVSTGQSDTVWLDVSVCQGQAHFAGGAWQTTAGNYTDAYLNAAGCDSIVVTQLSIQPNVLNNPTYQICQGDSLFAAGAWQSTTGFYVDVLNSAAGCDSIVVSFLEVIPAINLIRNRQICEGQSIFLAGAWQTISGVYVDAFTGANGCDSNVVTTLNVLQPITHDVLIQLCPGESVIIAGSLVSTPGVYTESLPSAAGCDSITTYTVESRPIITHTIPLSICNGDSAFIAGAWQHSSGVFDEIYSLPGACDSLVSTILNVLDPITASTTASLCPGDSVWTGAEWALSPGIYTALLSTSLGCDSLLTIEVLAQGISFGYVLIERCEGDSVFVAGSWQNISGMYIDTLNSASGCDSVLTTELVFQISFLDTLHWQLCLGDSIFAAGAWQSSAGVYTDLFSTSSGCDSIIVNTVQFGPMGMAYDTLIVCLGDSAFLGGAWQSTAGVYTDTLFSSGLCDTLLHTTLITQFISYPQTLLLCEGDSMYAGGAWQYGGGLFVDTLSSSLGCDSVVYTTLILSPRESYYVERALCLGDSAYLAGSWQTTAGLYVDTFSNTLGCDSIMQTQLSFIPFYFGFDTLYICDGDSIPGLPRLGTGSSSGSTWLRDGEITFVDTLVASGGCDSIVVYTIITHPNSSGYAEYSICAGDSMMLGGVWVSSPGMFTDTLVNHWGCDSVLTVRLSVVDTFQVYRDWDICFGDSAELQPGLWISLPGLYIDTFLSRTGCDSIVYTTLNIIPLAQSNLSVSFCSGDSVYVLGEWRHEPGTWTETLLSVTGCDSLVHYMLDTIPLSRSYPVTAICSGDSVWLAAAWRDSPGFYTERLSAASGCDSIVRHQLIVRPVYTLGENLSLCLGDSVFAAGAWQHSSGVYADTLQSVFGCDSIRWTTVNVLPEAGSVHYASICQGDSAFFNGQWYSATGVHTQLFPASNGCDSLVQFNLQVNLPWSGNSSMSICSGDSVFLSGAWQSSSGVYTEWLSTAAGCDSVVSIDLQVNPSYALSETHQICFGDSLWLGGAWQSLPGVYTEYGLTQLGCDSMRTVQLLVQPLSSSLTIAEICPGDSMFAAGAWQSTSGVYSQVHMAANGCDSIANLQIIVLPQVVDTLVVERCEGEFYYAAGAWQGTPGFYTDQFSGPDACPALRITDLRFSPVFSDTIQWRLCRGDSVYAASQWISESGWYSEQLLSANGCDSTIWYGIEVDELHQELIAVQACQGDSIWAGGAWQSESGLYTDVYSSALGCDSSISIELMIAPRYFEEFAIDLCEGESFVLGSDTLSSTGIYTLSYTTAQGCDSILHYSLTVAPWSVEHYELSFCQGDSTYLLEQWFSEAGVFTDTLRPAESCPVVRIVEVALREPALIYAPDTLICLGQRVQLQASGASNYLWTPSEGLSCTDCSDPWVEVTSTTLYTVSTTDACMLLPYAESLVQVVPGPEVDAGMDQAIAPGQSVNLLADGVGNGPLLYWWEQDGQRICTDCPEWVLVPQNGADYTVWVEDGLGCRASDQVSIEVDNSCIDGRFDPANAFSPNADGFNDEFVIRYTGPATVDRVRIFNRWGELLFETEDPEVRWNGVFRGKLLDPGVYVYYLEGLCEDDRKFLHVGNVTLIR